jgi:3-hydroxyisobutyrate dehydrogenase-like beta-hydroxyacid dehydrogenase
MLTVHHVLPKSLGGRDIDTNIVKICTTCHNKIHGTKNVFSSSLIKNRLNILKNDGQSLGPPTKVNDGIISMFNELKNQGYSYKDISENTGFSVGTIHKYTSDKGRE